MMINEAIKKAVDRVDLTAEEAESVLEQIMAGQCTDAQIASLLTALRMKGETVAELTGFARVMRRKAAHVRPHTTVSAEIGDTERLSAEARMWSKRSASRSTFSLIESRGASTRLESGFFTPHCFTTR